MTIRTEAILEILIPLLGIANVIVPLYIIIFH